MQRQKAAYEDEIRTCHQKLVELQRALTEERNLRCAVHILATENKRPAKQSREGQLEAQLFVAESRLGERDAANQALLLELQCREQLAETEQKLQGAESTATRAGRLRAAGGRAHERVGMWQEGLAREASVRIRGGQVVLSLVQDFVELKRHADAAIEGVKAEMAESHRSRQSDLRMIESLSTVVGMRDDHSKDEQRFVEDSIASLETQLQRTLELVEQQQQHAQQQLGSNSSIIAALHSELRAKEASVQTYQAEAEAAGVAGDHLRLELDELSSRYAVLKADKSVGEEQVQRSAKALEDLLQQKETDEIKGKARESRVRALSLEVMECEDRLGQEQAARRQAEMELEEIGTKLVAATSQLGFLEAKCNQIQALSSEQEQSKRELAVALGDAQSKLESCQEENRRRKSVAGDA